MNEENGRLVFVHFTDYHLSAQMSYSNGALTPTGLREEHLIPVQKWCEENNCGVRMSFDRFRFRNQKEITMFLLRWGSP
jgi:hypothetical protein